MLGGGLYRNCIGGKQRTTYGSHYLDIRAYLISLYNPGIPQDVIDQGHDIPPSSLRSDAIHLTATGYADVANYINQNITILQEGSNSVLTPSNVMTLFGSTPPIGVLSRNTAYFSTVGIGTSSPSNMFDVRGNGTNNLAEFYSGTGTSVFKISNNGNVGIGTTTPFGRLDVVGTTNPMPGHVVLGDNGNHAAQVALYKWTGTGITYYQNTIIDSVDGPGTLSFQTGTAGGSGIGSDAQTTRLAILKNTGYVGIGTTTPYSRLTIWGPDALAGTAAFTISNSASTTEFQVFDNGAATLAGTLTQNSDQRLKQEIIPLNASSTLAAITGLTPVSFIWRDLSQGSTTQLGFIAQDVQQIFPQLVSTTSATTLTPDGTLGLNYIGLIAPIVEAIKELAGQVSGFAQSITTAVLNATTGNFTNVNSANVNSAVDSTQKLCVGSTCVDEAQLKTMLQNSGQQSNQQQSGGGGGTGGSGDTSATFSITVTQGENGTISPDTQTGIASSTNLSFTITPNTGYDIATLVVDGEATTTSTAYDFVNVTGNHTIGATFASTTPN